MYREIFLFAKNNKTQIPVISNYTVSSLSYFRKNLIKNGLFLYTKFDMEKSCNFNEIISFKEPCDAYCTYKIIDDKQPKFTNLDIIAIEFKKDNIKIYLDNSNITYFELKNVEFFCLNCLN